MSHRLLTNADIQEMIAGSPEGGRLHYRKAGTRSGPALAPDNAGKGGGTGQRRRMERVKAMAHNVKVYDVGR